jgi:hypothetical protein
LSPRKKPIIHKVGSYTRKDGTLVTGHVRGSRRPPKNKTEARKRDILEPGIQVIRIKDYSDLNISGHNWLLDNYDLKDLKGKFIDIVGTDGDSFIPTGKSFTGELINVHLATRPRLMTGVGHVTKKVTIKISKDGRRYVNEMII